MVRVSLSCIAATAAAIVGVGCAPLAAPPPPSDALGVARALADSPASIERVTTADGASLAFKRYAAAGAPMILIHGLAINAESWDLPPLDGPGYTYRSLASELRDAGYDVWLLNLRGHGNGDSRSRPPPGQTDWSIDHFALYDVPAAVEHVATTTGRKPFVIASSLGAMALAAWLEGAQLVDASDMTGVPESKTQDPKSKIEASAALAASRQSILAGAVYVAFPAALRWPQSPIDDADRVVWGSLLAGLLSDTADANVVFEAAAYSPGLQGALDLYGSLPLRFLRPNEDLEAWEDRLPSPLAKLLDDIDKALFALGADLLGTFNGGSRGRLDVVLAARREVLDDVEAGVLRQFASSTRAGAFVSDLGQPPLIYSDHYGNIALPAFIILGAQDRNANATVVREAFFDVIASPDKTIRVFDGLAHGEFEMAPIATARVYPEILAWIEQRTARSTDSP